MDDQLADAIERWIASECDCRIDCGGHGAEEAVEDICERVRVKAIRIANTMAAERRRKWVQAGLRADERAAKAALKKLKPR